MTRNRYNRTSRLRFISFVLLVVAVTALALGNPGWVGPVLAQTVPTKTYTPGGPTEPPPTGVPPTASPPADSPSPTGAVTQPPAGTASPTAPAATATPRATARPATPTVPPALLACGPGPYSQASALSRPRHSLMIGLGSVVFMAPIGLTGPGVRPTNIVSATVEAVPLAGLPPAPQGWTALICGLRVSAVTEAGAAVTYLPSGMTVCVRRPADLEPDARARLAYFDERPNLQRWVLLRTRTIGSLDCTMRFRTPGLFAVLDAES